MRNISKGSFLSYMNTDFNKNYFNINDYNNKKNIELRNKINNIKFDKVDELYSLLKQYKENINDKRILKIIKSQIELNKYNIKGIYLKSNETFSSLNIYTDLILDELKYNIHFDLYKIINKEKNKDIKAIIKRENNKYPIILLNLNEEIKKCLEKNLNNFQRAVLLFTNLEATLELDSLGLYFFSFKSTYKTKIYMEKNKISDINESKITFKSSGIYIDFLKSNEFSYILPINTYKLFSLKETKLKNTFIKGYNFMINTDLKEYLEIDSETSYIECFIDKYKKNKNFSLDCVLC